MRELFKTIFLLFLVALAIFQTGELWLGRVTDRNFFTIWASPTTGPNYEGYFFVPTRILTNLGSNRFAPTYGNDIFALTNVEHILTTALQSEPVETMLPDANIFNQRSVIYHYTFNMPTTMLLSYLGIPLQNTILQYLPTFNEIVFVPEEDNYTRVYFVGGDVVVQYFAQTSATQYLHTKIQNTNRYRNDEEIHYISTELMGFNLQQNMFVPRWRGQSLTYYTLATQDIDQDLTVFFQNQATIWRGTREGATIYGDFNIIVSYYNNMLEYTNNRQGNVATTTTQDFDTAFAFISRDTNITNQVMLSSFSVGYNYTTFYFDYVVNNMPVFLQGGSWLQVTVENGEVTHYTRATFGIELSTHTARQYQDIINLVDTHGQGILPRFGYIFEQGASVYLGWRK